MSLNYKLPTVQEMQEDFNNRRYKEARKKADRLFKYGRNSELRLAADVCAAAQEHFLSLISNGGRKKAEQLADMFPECRFESWIAQYDKNHKLNKAGRRN